MKRVRKKLQVKRKNSYIVIAPSREPLWLILTCIGLDCGGGIEPMLDDVLCIGPLSALKKNATIERTSLNF